MDRSADRTLFIYRGNGGNKVLGGLVNTKGITNKNLYDMIEILLVFDSTYTLAHEGETVCKDDAELKPGNYYVYGNSSTYVHS